MTMPNNSGKYVAFARPDVVEALLGGKLPSKRTQEWDEFSNAVFDHIENYTVPQYGDMPDDQMTTASIEDIKHDMTRYINRMGTNARGASEGLRDMLKLAHYACIAHAKLQEQERG